jgi:hypothetical protein
MNFELIIITLSTMKKIILLLTCFPLFFVSAQVSKLTMSVTNPGKVEYVADARIDSLISRHRSISENKGTIDGYRIQIFNASGTNSKKQANDVKADLMQKYPEIESYVIYQAPNFKVRLGDFRNRMEAQKVLNDIKKEYSSAYIVKDEINLPSLN